MSYLIHYGTKRHSGRYPWGSGKEPYQSASEFLGRVEELRKQGMSEAEIARGYGISTTLLRANKSVANAEEKAALRSQILELKEKGWSNRAIGEKLCKNESTIRSLLDEARQERQDAVFKTAEVLKNKVSEDRYLDVGAGTELHMGISRTKLQTSLEILKSEGYEVYNIDVKQLGTGKNTTIQTLVPPGTDFVTAARNKDRIKMFTDYSEDGGLTYSKIELPRSVNSKRILVRFKEDGGEDQDGLIELRRGVDDISLGNARYAQVRISVDGKYYLKGMAVYSDNLPDGVDIVYNSNKSKKEYDKFGAMKKMNMKNGKIDPDNPFGASIKSEDSLLLTQRHYIDKDGNKRLSALNVVNEEGNWSKWSNKLSSQFLSKQSPKLAKQQLDKAYNLKKAEFDEIKSLTNPAVKKKLLEGFAEECDSDAVHLHAAALPRQKWSVLIPSTTLKDNEIYAPAFKNGEEVKLVRYPHGGIFEIPTLKVNNNDKQAIARLGKSPKDAVSISKKVADRLSGADFDGDSVLVIPTANTKIRSKSALEGLKDFDPKEQYKGYPGMKVITNRMKQQKMGDVSNLITDMTIQGAPDSDIAKAVRHSMVIIDSEKHKLNWKQSYIDNDIAYLKEKYQGSKNAGASTLISKASSRQEVVQRKEITNTKKMTPSELARYNQGKKVYREKENNTYVVKQRSAEKDPITGKYTYTVKTNKEGAPVTKKRTQTSTKMYEVDDAFKLSSGTEIERVYAEYANSMKALGDSARLEYRGTQNQKYSPSAKKVYDKEVKSLDAKLNIAEKNAPLERQAQLVANSIIKAKKESNPDMDEATLKKERGRALEAARERVGAKKQTVTITDKEWEAIQAGAISHNKLTRILNNSNLDRVKELATPRKSTTISSSQLSRARSMLEGDKYTISEVAAILGVSVSSLNKAL